MIRDQKIIVQIKFGSHLYGTATPESDLDIKGVYLPSGRDILLQKVVPVISDDRNKEHGQKNTAQDTDYECYSLQRYLKLLAEGQTVALDMLFAPSWAFINSPDPIWGDIQALSSQILTRDAAAMVRYCQKQANKYGIKGSRIAAARTALAVLTDAARQHGLQSRLETARHELESMVAAHQFLGFSEMTDMQGSKIAYLEICGKKIMMSASIKAACDITQQLVDEYGQRALAAERNEGVDWKALSHAVRVAQQAIEFLSTGRITFPRPEAPYLRAIKSGQRSYVEIANMIETLLAGVEHAAAHSHLATTIDMRVIDDFIAQTYRQQICIT